MRAVAIDAADHGTHPVFIKETHNHIRSGSPGVGSPPMNQTKRLALITTIGICLVDRQVRTPPQGESQGIVGERSEKTDAYVLYIHGIVASIPRVARWFVKHSFVRRNGRGSRSQTEIQPHLNPPQSWGSGRKLFFDVNLTRTLPNLGEGTSHRTHIFGQNVCSDEPVDRRICVLFLPQDWGRFRGG